VLSIAAVVDGAELTGGDPPQAQQAASATKAPAYL